MLAGMTQHMNSEQQGIEVRHANTAHDDVLALVQSTTFGSGNLAYQRLDVQSQLARFNAPVFFHALAEEQLVGVYVLDKRRLQLGERFVEGYYRGVLAVDAQWQGRRVGKRLTEAARLWLTNRTLNNTVISYGCIDQDNHRSLRLLESGGATIGSALSMYMMYRQWPAVRCDLAAMGRQHQQQLNVMADELYAQCRVRDVSPSKMPGYVLQDEHGVVVGARVADTSFRITGMSKTASWFTQLCVKPFASARRRFDPECFRYVSFTEVVMRQGCERRWTEFVSTVLARHDCHFGVVYVDPQSQLFNRLQSSGAINRFLHSSTGSINVVWQTCGDADLQDLAFDEQLHPLHLWPVDA